MAGKWMIEWGLAAMLVVHGDLVTAATIDIGTLADNSTTMISGTADTAAGRGDTWLFDIAGPGALFSAVLTSTGGSAQLVWSLEDSTEAVIAYGANPVWSAPFTVVDMITLSSGSYSLLIGDLSFVGNTYVIELITGNGSGDGGSYHAGGGVGAVPLPAAAWLMLSGLAGLGLLGRKQKS